MPGIATNTEFLNEHDEVLARRAELVEKLVAGHADVESG